MTCWLDYIVYNQWEWVGITNDIYLAAMTLSNFSLFSLFTANFFCVVIQIENVILSIAVTTWLFPKITTTTWLKNWSDFWGRKVQSLYCICLVTDVCTSQQQQQEQKAFEKGHSTLAAQKIVGEAIYIGRQGWCRVKSWSEKCIAAWMGTRRATGGKMSRLPAHYATIDPRSVAPIVE